MKTTRTWMIFLATFMILFSTFSGVSAYDKKCTVLYGGTFCFNGTDILGVNMSVQAVNVLNPIWLNLTDQRYNDTAYILSTNASMKTYVDNTFYLKSNPYNFLNSTSALILSLIANTSSSGTTISSLITNTTNLQSNMNSLSSNVSTLQTTTNSLVTNTTNLQSNVNSLATNTTTLQTTTNSLVTNTTTLQTTTNSLVTNTSTLQTTTGSLVSNLTGEISNRQTNDSALGDRIDAVNSTANGKASPGSCSAGEYVVNTTTSGVQCLPVTASTANYSQYVNESNVNGSAINFVYLSFNTTSGVPSVLQNGTCYYTDGADSQYNCVIDADNSVVLQLGEELYLDKVAKNGDTVTIDNCAPVYLSGSVGGNAVIKRAKDTPYRQAQAFVGLATQSIAVNGFGRVTIRGSVGDCNTAAWSIGTALYLSNQSGNLTNVTPTGGQTKYFVGIVTVSNANNGKISVQPMFIPSPDDLSFVNWVNTSNGVLVYNSATGVWGVENLQSYNDSGINTTLNIQGLGFNTTAQLNNVFALIGTGDNASWNKSYADTLYLNQTDQRYNDSAAIGNEATYRVGNDTLLNTSIIGNASRLETEILARQSIGNLTAQGIAVRDPTGFLDRTSSSLSFNNNTMNLTFVGTYDIYINGTKSTRINDSIIVASTSGLHFVYYDDFSGLKQSVTPWEFESIVQGATVYWDGANAIIGDERHGIGMDWRTHEYLHETVGARYADGLAGTFNNTNLSIGTGEFYDEDNEFEITSTLRVCKVVYHKNASTLSWLNDTSLYFYKNATNLYYDNLTDLVAAGSNSYMAAWIFITNDKDTPIMCVVGQRTDTSIADARANNNFETLNLGTTSVPEMKLLYRVIIRNDATPYEETLDYRTVSTLSSGNYVATDHGTLAGLADDDHTQYLLRTDASVYNDTTLINAVNTSLNIQGLGFNTTTQLDVRYPKLSGTNIFTGTNYINTTLNIMDGAGANGTTIQGDTIWTGTLYVVNISSANVVNPITVNGSYIPILSDTFYLGNATRVWKEVRGTNLYGTLNASYVQNPYWLNITDQRYNDTPGVDALNSSKSSIGSSAACTYGVANITLNAQGVPSVTCASAQGDITSVVAGTGMTGGATSGDATLNWNATYGVSALGNYSAASGSIVTGSGTAGYLSVWSNSTNISKSNLYQNGSYFGIGAAVAGNYLEVTGSGSDDANIRIRNSNTTGISGFGANNNNGIGTGLAYASYGSAYTGSTTGVAKAGLSRIWATNATFVISTFSDNSLILGAYDSMKINISSTNVAVNGTLSATGNINVTDTGSCIYLPGGGRICGNSTTVSIIAP